MPSFATSLKIGPDFSKKVVLKLKLPKNHFNKEGAPKKLLLNEKNQKGSNDFLHRKFTMKSSISALCDELAKLGKVSQDAYNPGLWLILYDLLTNWVAEGVASDVNDFT